MQQTKTQKEKQNGILRRYALAAFVFICCIFFPHQADAGAMVKPANNLGLVGYWSFNDGTGTTATDFSGNGNTGTLTNMSAPATATSGWGKGKLGGGLNFDGTNDYVNFGTGNSLNLSTGGTISMWFKKNGNGGGSYQALIQRFDASVTGYQIYINNSDNIVRFYTNTVLASTYTLSDSNWHHYVVVNDGTTTHFFVDGVARGSGAQSMVSVTSPTTNNIGNYSSSGITNGAFDEVRIYSRALSATEVGALYSSGAEKLKVGPSNSGLVGYWSFNDGTGTTAADFSGNGNTGTLTNMSAPATATSGWGNGKLGGGLNFDGADDAVNLGGSTLLTPATAATYSAWVYIDGVNANYGTIISKYGITTNPLWIGTDGGNSTQIDVCFANSCALNITGLTLNKWIHIVLTNNGSTVVAYVDGVQSITAAGSLISGGGVTSIGYDINRANYPFKGKIDEVRIYSRALSATEVTTLYTAGTQKINASRNVTGSSLDNGLVGLWSFDGKDMNGATAYDRSGNGNDGTLTNGPVPAIGKMGQALSFDGVDDYVGVSDSNSLDLTTHFTISLWMKSSNISQYQTYLLSKLNNSGSDNVYSILYNYGGGRVQFYCGAGCGIGMSGSEMFVTDTGWHHIVYDYDGSTFTGYVDGVQKISQTAAAILNPSTGNLLFASFNGGQNYFNGSLDDVRIYNRALSASEIKLLYNTGK
jgi:hypothetical protein